MNNRIIFAATAFAFFTLNADALCIMTKIIYTSCKPGYYFESSSDCVKCPTSGGISGMTVDKNKGGITSCYLPSGSKDSDSSGTFTYTSNCYYAN